MASGSPRRARKKGGDRQPPHRAPAWQGARGPGRVAPRGCHALARPGRAAGGGARCARRARPQASDARRRGKGDVCGAVQAATRAAGTRCQDGRTSVTWVALLAQGDAWLPAAAARVGAARSTQHASGAGGAARLAGAAALGVRLPAQRGGRAAPACAVGANAVCAGVAGAAGRALGRGHAGQCGSHDRWACAAPARCLGAPSSPAAMPPRRHWPLAKRRLNLAAAPLSRRVQRVTVSRGRDAKIK